VHGAFHFTWQNLANKYNYIEDLTKYLFVSFLIGSKAELIDATSSWFEILDQTV